jgi:cytochrome c-type biogenesis protein CcsB
MSRFRFFIMIVSLPAVLALARDAPALDVSAIRTLAVQDNGRVKPLDTYAREKVRTMCGRGGVAGEDPIETVLSIAFATDEWADYPLFAVPQVPLLTALGFPQEKQRLSPVEVDQSVSLLEALAGGSRGRRLAEAAVELEQRVIVYGDLIRLERVLPIVPPPSGTAETPWMALTSATGYTAEAIEQVRTVFEGLREAFVAGDQRAFDDAAARLTALLRALDPATYPSNERLALEVQYNALQPFRAAWVLYILTFLLALVSLWSRQRGLYIAVLVALALSLAIHTGGLLVRTILAGRAPLTNMYESLVLMSWGIGALGLVFELRYRLRYAALVASFLGVITIAIAQRLNVEIEPAVAVLRSVWLSYHVLTVMLGYSAFAVALGAGHIAVGRYAFTAPGSRPPDRLNDFVYRVLQVGVLFLAAGIITGSIWANYSWGRYWGWDPKETWSLITLLGYLAVLHARRQGWLRGLGTGVASILCFLLVVMTYYGVNYILHGLHSYAGEGPQRIPAWLIAYVSVELGYVGAAAILANARRTKREPSADEPTEQPAAVAAAEQAHPSTSRTTAERASGFNREGAARDARSDAPGRPAAPLR